LTCVNQPKTLAVSDVISFLSLQVFVRKARLKDWREIQGSTLRGNIDSGRERWRRSIHESSFRCVGTVTFAWRQRGKTR
jgi:hypothetical protein